MKTEDFENLLLKLNQTESNHNANISTINKDYFYGREKELGYLNKLTTSLNSQGITVGVHGSRRTGKTSFVKEFIKKENNNSYNDFEIFSFEFVGMFNEDTHKNVLNSLFELQNRLNFYIDKFQIEKKVKSFNAFISDISDFTKTEDDKYNWFLFFQYFQYVVDFLLSADLVISNKNKAVYVFFDEMSWFSKKEEFISEFSYFWNKYGANRTYFMCFLATSNVSWFNSKVFNDTKNLFRRIVKIEIKPFSFNEIYDFFKVKGWNLDKEEILRYYLMFGGFIKHYLENKYIDFSLPLEQNIQNVNANYDYIEDEYKAMFRGVFSEKKQYRQILKIVVNKKGISLEEICDRLKETGIVKNREYIRTQLKELEESGFLFSVRSNIKDKQLYFLCNISLINFYHFWVENNIVFDIKEQYYNWQGKEFEIFVFNNLENIFSKLNLPKCYFTLNFSLTYENLLKNNDKRVAVQFDMLAEKITQHKNKERKREFYVVETKIYNKNKGIDNVELEKLEIRKEIIKKYFDLNKNKKNTKVNSLILSVTDKNNMINVLSLI